MLSFLKYKNPTLNHPKLKSTFNDTVTNLPGYSHDEIALWLNEHEAKFSNVLKALPQENRVGDILFKNLIEHKTAGFLNHIGSTSKTVYWKYTDCSDTNVFLVSSNDARHKMFETASKLGDFNPDFMCARFFEKKNEYSEIYASSKNFRSDITALKDFDEIVCRVAKQVLNKSVSLNDLSFFIDYANVDFLAATIILLPFLFTTLQRLLWTKVCACLFAPGGFITLITSVITKISSPVLKKVFSHPFTTFKLTTKIKYIGFSGLSTILLLYSGVFIKKQNRILWNPVVYTGFSGFLGQSTQFFRDQGAKLVFEGAKTFSTFSNAFIAGFLEPKQDFFKDFFKYLIQETKKITKG